MKNVSHLESCTFFFLKNRNSMNPREPAIGYLLANFLFHTFPVSHGRPVEAVKHCVHMISKAFSNQRVTLPKPCYWFCFKELEPQLCSGGRGKGIAICCSESWKVSVCRHVLATGDGICISNSFPGGVVSECKSSAKPVWCPPPIPFWSGGTTEWDQKLTF